MEKELIRFAFCNWQSAVIVCKLKYCPWQFRYPVPRSVVRPPTIFIPLDSMAIDVVQDQTSTNISRLRIWIYKTSANRYTDISAGLRVWFLSFFFFGKRCIIQNLEKACQAWVKTGVTFRFSCLKLKRCRRRMGQNFTEMLESIPEKYLFSMFLNFILFSYFLMSSTEKTYISHFLFPLCSFFLCNFTSNEANFQWISYSQNPKKK